MRLINSETLELKEFFESDLPPYAILSHTWEEDEVSFQDMEQKLPSLRSKKGYQKIAWACRLAHSGDALCWVWVDTCCIDKSSSAELTEAINSMFRWYKEAHICYAYLSGWEPAVEEGDGVGNLADCRWFTRGWTLQELIAPRVIKFYDQTGAMRGTKASLVVKLASITGIRSSALSMDTLRVSRFSIAERMSWAATRRTKRMEDMAYCLLGLFNVNMPMMYGEGTNAFKRLQEELCRQTSDLTIFAWAGDSSLFAPSPSKFQFGPEHLGYRALDRGLIRPALIYKRMFEHSTTNKGLRVEGYRALDDRPGLVVISPTLIYSNITEHSTTNKGLRVEGSLLRLENREVKGTNHCSGEYYFELGSVQVYEHNYDNIKPQETFSIGIMLRKYAPSKYVRSPEGLQFLHYHNNHRPNLETRQEIFFISRERVEIDELVYEPRRPVFAFDLDRLITSVSQVLPETHWDINRQLFFQSRENNRAVFAAEMEVGSFGKPGHFKFIVALNQSGAEREVHLFECFYLPSKFFTWFTRNRGPREIPSWEEFLSEINQPQVREELRDTIIVSRETATYRITARILDPYDSYVDVSVIRRQWRGLSDMSKPIIVILRVTETPTTGWPRKDSENAEQIHP